MTEKIDMVGLIDSAIKDCLAAKLPLSSWIIAETLTYLFFRNESVEGRAEQFVYLEALTRERIENFGTHESAVN
jgi:hypothetical protein